MKLALEVALGVVLGGLALDGLHECQRIVRNHLEQDAQPANITTHHTLNPDADQRTAPRQDLHRRDQPGIRLPGICVHADGAGGRPADDRTVRPTGVPAL